MKIIKDTMIFKYDYNCFGSIFILDKSWTTINKI